MSAHSFTNTPMLVVVFNGPNRFENYCQCGFRAHAQTKAEITVSERFHLNKVSAIVAEFPLKGSR